MSISAPARIPKLPLLLIGLLASPAALAGEEPIVGSDYQCPSGARYWVFVKGVDGECGEVGSGVYECWDPADDDETRLDCDDGCEHFVSEAGCRRKSQIYFLGDPTVPQLTIECENGKLYKMTHEDADGNCSATQDSGGDVIGGECTSPDGEGGTEVDAAMDCDDGCQHDGGPAECECVSCS